MRRGLASALAVVVVLGLAALTASPAAAKKRKTTPTELEGCRLFAAAYDPTLGTDLQTQFAADALVDFGKSKNPGLHDLVHRTAAPRVNPTYSMDLGAWCEVHDWKDNAVRSAHYPTTPNPAT
jgi:hypothetical protein